MRSNQELLQVFLENKGLFWSGLCAWITRLNEFDIITNDEYFHLTEIVGKNKPFLTKICLQGKRGFYWEQSKIEPRIKFLKKHLK